MTLARDRWASRNCCRFITACAAVALLGVAACKTSDDAAAAATQMTATAQALSDYYTAVGKIVSNTEAIYQLNDQLEGKEYSPRAKAAIEGTKAELASRVKLAQDLTELAASFAGLAGSTAPADVAASAQSLDAEVHTLSSTTESSAEQQGLRDALTLLVKAIQEHKEREAATDMMGVAKGFSALFQKEKPIWISREQVYAMLSAGLAKDLVDAGDTDNTAMLKVALDPFGLTPGTLADDTRTKLKSVAKAQIEVRRDAAEADFASATEAMQSSLDEMAKRIEAVAQEKPMAYRKPPLTIANVQTWAAHVMAY
jgi:hypothetical protein